MGMDKFSISLFKFIWLTKNIFKHCDMGYPMGP
uniref:Uncharacterized protein n=1 Tax=Setaria italica TaxID=4555 RepID=K3ZGC6_SETIT